eukprot:CAMPEP_0202910994 /NCGR_PEP_ID=MMETSP1392-20130828/53682_1 /ASSEMBLY_ACC=CAM_ASM_000868 /TAXON_ID=225041 /ORGANISM="Chlamydomonas chlamydogama, Strain SAG 11-48b" /LENGTH=90 /DNA_ID=CAMNT_0049601323 /DNA_START=612 /DNA_END=881 /DNA_ORIENTATION=-
MTPSSPQHLIQSGPRDAALAVVRPVHVACQGVGGLAADALAADALALTVLQAPASHALREEVHLGDQVLVHRLAQLHRVRVISWQCPCRW